VRSYLLIAPDSNELFRLFLGDNFESIPGLADGLEELPLLLCRGISLSLGVSSDRIGEFCVVVVLVVVIHCILVLLGTFMSNFSTGLAFEPGLLTCSLLKDLAPPVMYCSAHLCALVYFLSTLSTM